MAVQPNPPMRLIGVLLLASDVGIDVTKFSVGLVIPLMEEFRLTIWDV